MQIFNDSVFDKFPMIKTSSLLLREIVVNDAEALYKNYSDKVVMKYFGRDLYTNVSEAIDKINSTESDFVNRIGIRWAICNKDDNIMIGSGGLWRLLKEHLRAEIGYELSKDHWGKGIMTEALQAIINFGFENMRLHSIEANIDPDNIGSDKLLKKLGFIKEGHFKDSFLFNGKFTDTASYSLINLKDSFYK